MSQKIQRINETLREYFTKHPSAGPIPAKQFMDAFVKAGIFSADRKDGLPIRALLRDLDKNKQLHLVPYVIAERKAQNTNWFFGPALATRVTVTLVKRQKETPKLTNGSTAAPKPRPDSDECYVLDLCDEVLGLHSVRQHRFPFLVGDPNPAGTAAQLPVDAWYETLKLVIEYNERQHTEAVKFFDRKETLSGVSRGEQRTIYDKRKREVPPKHGITVVTLSYTDFQHGRNKRLLRNIEVDKAVVHSRLSQCLKLKKT